MKKIKLEHFELTKISLKKGNVPEIKFNLSKTESGSIYNGKGSLQINIEPHEDLISEMRKLLPMLSKVDKMDYIKTVVMSDDFHATKEQVQIAEGRYQELRDRLDVTGLSISGLDDNKGFIIIGTKETDKGVNKSMLTDRIKFNEITYGFEQDVNDIYQRIEEECYQYLFAGKKMQLDAFEDNTDAGSEG